jgi:hypothetical protein
LLTIGHFSLELVEFFGGLQEDVGLKLVFVDELVLKHLEHPVFLLGSQVSFLEFGVEVVDLGRLLIPLSLHFLLLLLGPGQHLLGVLQIFPQIFNFDLCQSHGVLVVSLVVGRVVFSEF